MNHIYCLSHIMSPDTLFVGELIIMTKQKQVEGGIGRGKGREGKVQESL